MNIFIIGKSTHGKTPLIQHLDGNIISASAWIKNKEEKYKFSAITDRDEYIKYISECSVDELKINDLQPTEHIKSNLKDGINIIDGLRNIKDFIILHNHDDKVVFVNNTIKNDFEFSMDKGVDIIKQYCCWLTDIGLKKSQNVINIEYNNKFSEDDITKLIQGIQS